MLIFRLKYLLYFIVAYLMVLLSVPILGMGMYWGITILTWLNDLVVQYIPFVSETIAGTMFSLIGIVSVLILAGIAFGIRRYFYYFIRTQKPEKPQVQKQHHKDKAILKHNLQAIETLPNDNNLQELTAHDGEIPDDALQNRSN